MAKIKCNVITGVQGLDTDVMTGVQGFDTDVITGAEAATCKP